MNKVNTFTNSNLLYLLDIQSNYLFIYEDDFGFVTNLKFSKLENTLAFYN